MLRYYLHQFALSGCCRYRIHDQVDQVSKPILVAAASSATASSVCVMAGGCGKVFPYRNSDYIMGPEDVA